MKTRNFLLSISVLFLNALIAYGDRTIAQTPEQIITEIALEKFNQEFGTAQISIMNDFSDEIAYSDFTVSFVEEHDGWARIHITSIPNLVINEDGNTQGIVFYGAVARYSNNTWNIVFEGTKEFDSLKEELPIWLQFLNTEKIADVFDEVSVPSLPWALGKDWRLNGGLHDDALGLDFGTSPWTPPSELEGEPVHSVDQGEVIYAKDTCMVTRRNTDGLQMYYQHILKSDIDFWENNYVPIKMNQYLGRTTMEAGTIELCNGSTDGHHVHFSFLNSNPNGTGNWFSKDQYVNSSLNEWVINHTGTVEDGQTTMVKTFADGSTQVVTPNIGSGSNLNNRLLNSGCTAYHDNGNGYVSFYDQKNCTGESWHVNTLNQVINLPANFDPFSLNIRSGYSVTVFNPQSPPTMQACYSGDLWDMTKDYYPGTSFSIAGFIGSIIIEQGGCQCSGTNDKQNTLAIDSCPDTPPPPDILPPPPGPQTNNTVKIWGYANFEGPIFFTGTDGFSNDPDASGYSLEIPNNWSVWLFDQDGGNGGSRCFSSSVANLQDHGWQNRIQSIQIYENFNACPTEPPSSPSPEVKLYRHANYVDQVYSFGTGFEDNLSQVTSSIRIPDGWSAVVYAWDKRQVKAQCFNRNVPDLSAMSGWNDVIMSIDVFSYDACQDELNSTFDYIMWMDEGFTGSGCGGLGPAAFSSISNFCSSDWNDRISSIRVKKGFSVKVWEHDNFNGGSVCFSHGYTTMRNDAFNNGVSIAVYPPSNGDQDSRISSFAVFDNEHCDGSPEMPEAAWAYAVDNGTLALGQYVMSAEENNDQSIRIEWEPSLDPNNFGYRIYEHTDNDQYALLAELDYYSTFWVHDSLPCGTDFHYLVKAYNQWGESATPSLVSASTPACYVAEAPTSTTVFLPLVVKPEVNVPNAPTNLHPTNITANSISLAWKDNSNIEDSYLVWYRVPPGGNWSYLTTPANTTSKTITGLSCNTQYEIVVWAYVYAGGYYGESNWRLPTTLPCN